MSSEDVRFEALKSGAVKRSVRRNFAVFIDGTSLDRATKRLQKKIDLPALVRGICSGAQPTIARYYTIVPFEDDSRQRAFLEAVERSGLSVIVKRLPPKGITRQVSVDLEMAADIVAFASGRQDLPKETENLEQVAVAINEDVATEKSTPETVNNIKTLPEKRSIIVVCPSRELAYPISLANSFGADTTTADFAKTGDVLKSAAKWIDLSASETIWKE